MKKTMLLVLSLFLLLTLAVPAFAVSENDPDWQSAAETPSFTVRLEDGTPLAAQDSGSQQWLLVPKGVDRIRLSINPSGSVKDYYSRAEIAPENGNNYLLSFSDTRLSGDNLASFNKVLSTYILLGEKAPGKILDYGMYHTGAYSYVSFGANNEASVNLKICWQVDLPQPQNLTIKGAVFYTPFSDQDLEHQYVLDKGSNKAVFTFTASSNTENVYLEDADGKTVTNAVKVENGVYSFTIREQDFGDTETLTRYLVLENTKGYEQSIAFTGARRLVNTPDQVVDYLCIGSQYSDGGNQLTGIYGLYPEKSLIGRGYWWSPISLGNFGGSITYYYEDAITNDPHNPYGIDFIVYGNSNGGSGFSEPGNVLVSKDGKTWYTLAGSDHYEDGTKWDYQVIYTKEKDGSTSANGANLPFYQYPSPENYPLHQWSEEDKDHMMVSGVLLPFLSSGNAAFPAFGYADVHTNSSTAWGTGELVTVDCLAKDPYLSVTNRSAGLIAPENADKLYEGAGDCFDLDWAVDKSGLPVGISEIHYIKVQSASLTLGCGGIGEKSTEVNVVTPVMGNAVAVGVSTPPAQISVAGVALSLKPDVYEYTAAVKGPFTVEVKTAAETNVYINNLRAFSRDFAVAPAKGIIRVIVQNGIKEPLIYYITVNSEPLTQQDAVAALTAAAQNGASLSDGPMNRAMLIAALYQLSGDPEPGATDLKDLPMSFWYSKPVAWAAAKGILKGTEAGYEPEGKITREQLITMLYRYADFLGRDTSISASLSAYQDSPKISAWALDAMGWALCTGIITGSSNHDLDPDGDINKAQAAVFLQRFFEKMVPQVEN